MPTNNQTGASVGPYIHGYGAFRQPENSMFSDDQIQYIKDGCAKADQEFKALKAENEALMAAVAEMREVLEFGVARDDFYESKVYRYLRREFGSLFPSRKAEAKEQTK